MSKLRLLLHLTQDLWQMIVAYLPGKTGQLLRTRFWKTRLKFMGSGVVIDVGVYLQNPQFISLDDNCWIDRGVIIMAGAPGAGRVTLYKKNESFSLGEGEVYIGKNTHVAPNCVLSGIGGIYVGRNSGVASGSMIYSFSHHYRNLSDKDDTHQYSFTPKARADQQAMISGPIVIGDYCAIGLRSVILPGATIERGSWIASGALVSGVVDGQSVVSFDHEHRIKSLSDLTIKE